MNYNLSKDFNSIPTYIENQIMIKKIVIITVVFLFFQGCKQEKTLTAHQIIDTSIEVSGGSIISNATINFDFRDKQYKAVRKWGNFMFLRAFVKEGDSIFDLLSNRGFERVVNDEVVKVADSMVPRYSASVNSVHYFSVLPYGLNTPAVNKTYLNEVTIKGQTYHKIKVTFNEEGGGEDFEDVFIYFVNTTSFKLDYLAYSYAEDHGMGLRFREAYNERIVNGVRFVDYNNYKTINNGTSLETIEEDFKNNKLKLLSKIELENIHVQENL